jgi:pimeloyl-ACP methyl ester carboxylesterase
MRTRARLVGLVWLLAACVWPGGADAQVPVPPGCATGVLPSAARWMICMPPPGTWNNQLVLFAPGYTPPQLPLDFYYLSTADGTSLPNLVRSQGFAFATTTFRKNGLAVLQGVEDMQLLYAAFVAFVQAQGGAPPSRTHVTGVSEGGLVATLLAERRPELFRSALAACGPIGSFRQQINYVGDFRVLFDYYFPEVPLPGSAVFMPPTDPVTFEAVLRPAIAEAMMLRPLRALELMRVARVAYDPANLATVITSAVNLLRYNVLGLSDAITTLGGQPYSNQLRWYFGSSNDFRLNFSVPRYGAEASAVAAMRQYETNGDLQIPLVTIHTTLDDVAPFAHEWLYLPKVDLTARGRFVPIPINRYGHCNFTATEVGLSLLFAVSLP